METQQPSPGAVEERHLREMSSQDLVRHILQETKLLIRAEVLHAKAELRDEVRAAKTAGILLGVGSVLAIMGVSVLLVAIALALPLVPAIGALIVGAVVIAIAAVCLGAGYGRMPRKAMPETQERVRREVRLTRERLA